MVVGPLADITGMNWNPTPDLTRLGRAVAASLVLAGGVVRSLAAEATCDETALAARPGVWKTGTKGPTAPVTPPELAKERAVLGKIHGMVAKAYQPVGLAAQWTTVYSYTPGNDRYFANPYYYAVFFFKYWCQTGKEMVDGQGTSQTSLFIFANSTEWISYLKGNVPAENKFIGVRSLGEAKNGVIEFDLSGDGGADLHRQGFLVTYPGRLPYRPVTRKTYLELARTVLTAKIASSESADYYRKSLALVERALGAGAAALREQAIVAVAEVDGTAFSGFRTLTTGGNLLIEPNLEYFDRRLPRSSPQFFGVFLNVNERTPVYRAAGAAVRHAIDFEALRALLGK